MKHTFTEAELKMLSSLVGKKLKYIAGPDLWHPLTAPSVYIVTEEFSISLDASCEELEFNGDWEDFSDIHISMPSIDDVEEAVNWGYAYKKHSGDEILSVQVVADKISGELDRVQNLDYLSHSGVVLEFSNGYIAITKHDHHQPILIVSYGQEIKVEEVPVTSHRFDEDINQSFTFKRDLISIE